MARVPLIQGGGNAAEIADRARWRGADSEMAARGLIEGAATE